MIFILNVFLRDYHSQSLQRNFYMDVSCKGGCWGSYIRHLDRELNAKRLATWAQPLHVVVLRFCNTRYSTRAAAACSGSAWIKALDIVPGKLSTGYPQKTETYPQKSYPQVIHRKLKISSFCILYKIILW